MIIMLTYNLDFFNFFFYIQTKITTMNSRKIEEISRDITIMLEKQYRKAFQQGYKAALESKIDEKQLTSWMLSGQMQGYKIYEDPINQSYLPPMLLQQNNKDKGKEVFKKLSKGLSVDELTNFFNNNF